MQKILLLILLVTGFNLKPVTAQFTKGNLVLVRIGDGSAALGATATAVFFDEYTPDGTLVQSVPLPTSVNGVHKRLTLSGDKSDEGYISLSPDGGNVAIFGYDCDPGTSSPSTATSADVNRVVGVLSADESINTSKFITNMFSGVVVRSVAINGSNLWLTGGGSGIIHTTYNATGAGTANTTVTSSTGRVLGIYGGQLYTSSIATGIRMATVGTGTPTTAGQSLALLPGYPTATPSNPFQYVFLDLDPTVAGVDVLYVAEAAGLFKYSLVNNSWVSNGNIGGAYFGITGRVIENEVKVYATRRNGANLCEFVSLTDATGYNETIPGSVTVKATAPANTILRGIAFTPGTNVLPVSLGKFQVKAGLKEVLLSWTTLSEKNNSHFEVLRSVDGKHFVSIGQVKGSGSSDKLNSYTFADANPFPGQNYYKLRQVDFDDQSSESSIVTAKANGNELSLSLFPDENSLNVNVYSPVMGSATFTITDMSGRKVLQQKLNLEKGDRSFTLDGLSLPKGVYVSALTVGKEAIKTKFVR